MLFLELVVDGVVENFVCFFVNFVEFCVVVVVFGGEVFGVVVVVVNLDVFVGYFVVDFVGVEFCLCGFFDECFVVYF